MLFFVFSVLHYQRRQKKTLRRRFFLSLIHILGRQYTYLMSEKNKSNLIRASTFIPNDRTVFSNYHFYELRRYHTEPTDQYPLFQVFFFQILIDYILFVYFLGKTKSNCNANVWYRKILCWSIKKSCDSQVFLIWKKIFRRNYLHFLEILFTNER